MEENRDLEEEKTFAQIQIGESNKQPFFYENELSHENGGLEMFERGNFSENEQMYDSGEDEDERFFRDQEEGNNKAVAKISEDIDGLLNKGKNRALKYEELQRRRKLRQQRLIELDEMKTLLLLHLGRAFKFNEMVFHPMNRALVLSMLLTSYHQILEKDYAKSRYLPQQMEYVLENFLLMFGPSLDNDKECIYKSNLQVGRKLARREDLSRIEFLILFALFLSLHKLVVRVNFIIDVSELEKNKSLKVTRPPSTKKNFDKTEMKQENQVHQDKKRKFKDFFQEQARSRSNSNDTVQIQTTFKKVKLNPEPGESEEEKINTAAFDLLEQFAYQPGKKAVSLQKAKKMMGQKKKVVLEESQEVAESNLYLGKTTPVSRSEKKEPVAKLTQEKVTQLDETMSESIFIEVYDEANNRWLILCPFTKKVYTAKLPIQEYFSLKQVIFILSTQSYHSYESFSPSSIFMRELGVLYTPSNQVKDYMKAKNSCILSRSVTNFITSFGLYLERSADFKTRRIVNLEEKQIETVEMSVIPQSVAEFKNSKYYVLPSLIKKYQGFVPSAQPIEGKLFRGEPIYLRRDLTELHTRERWMKHGRKVSEGQEPYKRVLGLYNQSDKLAELFGFWQTEKWKHELTPDGKIPMNEYGNIEIFNGPLPESTVHVNVPKAALICRKLGIEHVPAVVGFEKGAHGKSHPCVSGVVTFEKFSHDIHQEYYRMEEKAKQRDQELTEKRIVKNWTTLVKGVLIKKYVTEKYGE